MLRSLFGGVGGSRVVYDVEDVTLCGGLLECCVRLLIVLIGGVICNLIGSPMRFSIWMFDHVPPWEISPLSVCADTYASFVAPSVWSRFSCT